MSERTELAEPLGAGEPGPEPAEATGQPLIPRTWADYRARYLAPTITTAALLVLVLAGGLSTPTFLNGSNLLNVVQVASLTGIIALGTTFLTLSGNFFSLSLEQTGALCSIAFAASLGWGWAWPAALLLALLIGAVTGLVQGVFVAFGANPIIVTIAAGAAIFGLAAVATNSRAQLIQGDSVRWLGDGQPLGVPITTWTFVLLAVIAQVVLVKTRYGRSTMLVGSNRATARSVGLPIGRVSTAAFVLAGLCAALAGVFVAAQSDRGLVSNLQGANLDVVAAVLVGGTSIQGGEGSVFRTALGAVFISLLQNILVLRGYSSGPRELVEGIVVVVGVSVFWLARGGRKR